MPGYIGKALTRLQHEQPKCPQNSPHKHVAPNYGAKAQYVEPNRISLLLDKELKKYLQAVTRTLLYYARSVDPTILIALNAIVTQQAAPMQNTMEEVKQVLDYCASQEEAILTYHASKMIFCSS